MAFYCEDCKIIYQKKYPNCPKCGEKLKSDSLSDDILLSCGYTLRGTKKQVTASASTLSTTEYKTKATEAVPKTDNNTINEIRAMFESGISANVADATTTISDTYSTTTITNTQASEHQTTTAFNNDTDTVPTSSASAFFDNPDAPEFRIAPIEKPKIVRTQFDQQTPTYAPFQTDNTTTHDENIFNDITNTQPRANAHRNRQSFLDNLRGMLFRFGNFRARHPFHIPWHLIRRFLPYILVIAIAIVIWSSREVIVNTILKIIVSIFPIALIVGIVVYLFRRLFRP